MMATLQILPPSKRRCADIAREAKAINSRCVVIRNRVVMLPFKAARYLRVEE
jgi:hypothetical protein